MQVSGGDHADHLRDSHAALHDKDVARAPKHVENLRHRVWLLSVIDTWKKKLVFILLHFLNRQIIYGRKTLPHFANHPPTFSRMCRLHEATAEKENGGW